MRGPILKPSEIPLRTKILQWKGPILKPSEIPSTTNTEN